MQAFPAVPTALPESAASEALWGELEQQQQTRLQKKASTQQSQPILAL